jgi:hypothetical protein
MAIAAAIGFLLMLIFYFTPHGTIAHSWGALVVLVSTGLMFVAAILITGFPLPRWLVGLFEVLIILDVLGSGVCAYFLEAYIVLALMVIALIGWLMRIAGGPARVSGS